ATTGDGILTSLKLMEVMLESKSKLSTLLKDITIYPQVLINVPVKDKQAVQEDAEVIKEVEAVREYLGKSGRILVRQSGTEPLIRVMVEAKTEELCQEQANRVVQVIKDRGYTTGE